MPNKKGSGLIVDSSPAEFVGGNTDLTLEILLRLPVKSVVRFKLVSKQWFSLISDPQFARAHTCRNPGTLLPPSGLFFYDSLTKSPAIQSVSFSRTGVSGLPTLGFRTDSSGLQTLGFLDDAFRGVEITVTQSCNGLLLLCCSYSDPARRDLADYMVFNPTTKQYRLLPRPDATSPESSTIGVSLAFDPSTSIHYKVIHVRRFRSYSIRGVDLGGSGYSCQMDIYSSKDQTWRPFAYHFCPSRHTSFEGGVFLSGVIHWKSGWYTCYRSLSFDVEAEKFIQIPMPPMPYSERYGGCRYFGGCLNHLHFIKCLPSAKKFCVLEMRSDYSKWDIKYRVSICRLVSAFPEIVRTTRYRGFEEPGYVFSVLCVVKGLKEEDSMLVLAIPGKIITYNFMHKTVKELCELPGQLVEPFRFHCDRAYPFIETLSLV